MSAPTSPPAPPNRDRPDGAGARSTRHTALDVAARVGTAGTLAALLAGTGTVLTLAHDEPTPVGISTTGR